MSVTCSQSREGIPVETDMEKLLDIFIEVGDWGFPVCLKTLEITIPHKKNAEQTKKSSS